MHGLFLNLQFSPEADVLIWKKSSSGNFSISDFYKVYLLQNQRMSILKFLWRPWIPVKVSTFCWKVCFNAIPTDDNIRKCGIAIVSKCNCCPSPMEESMDHLMFRSHSAGLVWQFLSRIFTRPPPSSIPHLFRYWLFTPSKNCFSDNLRSLLAQCAIWEIWKFRNHSRFASDRRNCIRLIKSWAARCINIIRGEPEFSLSNTIMWSLLEISPRPIRCQGRWMIWQPWPDGLSMSIFSCSKGASSFAAGILWTSRRKFVLALKFPISENCIFLGILEMIKQLRNLHLSVKCIASSQPLFDCISNPRFAPPLQARTAWKAVLGWGNVFHFMKCPPDFNNAAKIMAYSGQSGVTAVISSLPRVVRRSIVGTQLPSFIR